MKLMDSAPRRDKEPTVDDQGVLALQEMMTKATDWYNWTIREEVSIHPHNDYVPREYLMKLHEWMYPYVHRMYETENIDLDQLSKFTQLCTKLVFDLRVRCDQATWLYHWQEKGFIGRLKWRWKNKRIRKYDLRDFERLCAKTRHVPFL